MMVVAWEWFRGYLQVIIMTRIQQFTPSLPQQYSNSHTVNTIVQHTVILSDSQIFYFI